MALEIAVLRVTATASELSVYAFSGTLAAFILGSALGTALARRTTRAELALGLSVLGTVLAGLWLSEWSGIAARSGRPVMVDLLGALVLGVPAALPSSVAFVLVVEQRAKESAARDLDLGASLAASSLGAALAALVVVAFVLPFDGAHGAVLVSLLALALGAREVLLETTRWGFARGMVVLAAVLALGLPRPLGHWPARAGERVVASREDAQGLAQVVARGTDFLLRTGARAYEGGTRSELAEARQGLLPALLQSHPRKALVLGVGSGVTLGALARWPDLDVTAVEFSPSVLSMLPHFHSSTYGVETRPNVRFVAADARSDARARVARAEHFDVVLGELYHPQQAGVANLYTREAFTTDRELLAEHGVFMQWLPLHELSPQDLASIVRTFLEVFPRASAWYAHFNAETPALGLLGTREPWVIVARSLDAKLTQPALSSVLEPALFNRPWELLASYVTGPTGLRQLGEHGVLLTEDRPRLDYSAPLGLGLKFGTLDSVRAQMGITDDSLFVLGDDPRSIAERRNALLEHMRAVDALLLAQEQLARHELGAARESASRAVALAPGFEVGRLLVREIDAEERAAAPSENGQPPSSKMRSP